MFKDPAKKLGESLICGKTASWPRLEVELLAKSWREQQGLGLGGSQSTKSTLTEQLPRSVSI